MPWLSGLFAKPIIMIEIRVTVVDRTLSPFLKEGESFYLERLRKYVQVPSMILKNPRRG